MKYHIEIIREFDSTWGIMESAQEPTTEEMIKFVKEEKMIIDDPAYMKLIATQITYKK